MATEIGNLTQLAYIQEAQFGTTPSTPTGQLVRFTDLSLGPDANYIDNPEFRVDNMRAAGRRGAQARFAPFAFGSGRGGANPRLYKPPASPL